jgi:hypothetical protein
MALLGESLVEEWLNRDGFFTIRGVKHGHGEMDLLAIRWQEGLPVVGWHVEVQISFRPIGFISKIPKNVNADRQSARKRTSEQIDEYARIWVNEKFRTPSKAAIREKLWPGIRWEFHLVHAQVREPRELATFAQEGLILHPFKDILSKLSERGPFSASSGGDLAEIISYYKSSGPSPLADPKKPRS